MRMILGLISVFILCVTGALGPTAHAGEASARVYQTPETFVAQAFGGTAPAPQTLWPQKALRQELREILGHKPGLRFKYWGNAGRTVWILDEIGKDRPITAGVVIDQGQISDVQVLIFRESRGWEVKYDFFTNQFAQLWLQDDNRLNAHIDNITGATLSVKAMTRMARAALKLHSHSSQATTTVAHAR